MIFIVEVLKEMVSLLTGGITSIASGIGEGLSNLVTEIFLEKGTDGAYSLSVFGGVICIFGGISLAVGLSTMIVQWVSSLGN